MTQPKHLDSPYLEICQRTLHRTYRWVPSAVINAMLLFVLARACMKNGVRVVAAIFMINHHHLIVYVEDPAKAHQFVRDLHSGLARCTNRLQGLGGQVFDRDPPQTTPIKTAEMLATRVEYISNNALRAGCAASRHEYQGVLITPEQAGQTIVCQRCDAALGEATEAPETLPLHVHTPTEFMAPGETAEDIREATRVMLDHAETEVRADRRRKKLPIPSRKAMRASYAEMRRKKVWLVARPLTAEQRKRERGKAPAFFASTQHERRRELKRQAIFRRTHREAKERWEAGEDDVVFPHGTVKMHGKPRVLIDPHPIRV